MMPPHFRFNLFFFPFLSSYFKKNGCVMLMNTKKLLEKCKQTNIGFIFFSFLFNDEVFEV